MKKERLPDVRKKKKCSADYPLPKCDFSFNRGYVIHVARTWGAAHVSHSVIFFLFWLLMRKKLYESIVIAIWANIYGMFISLPLLPILLIVLIVLVALPLTIQQKCIVWHSAVYACLIGLLFWVYSSINNELRADEFFYTSIPAFLSTSIGLYLTTGSFLQFITMKPILIKFNHITP